MSENTTKKLKQIAQNLYSYHECEYSLSEYEYWAVEVEYVASEYEYLKFLLEYKYRVLQLWLNVERRFRVINIIEETVTMFY